ncbi:MAG: glycosyltransferase [Actinomycetota bacterium]
MSLPLPSLDHVARLTDDVGIAEHALGPVPRRTHGYCTDDNGRGLAVASRDRHDPRAPALAETYLAFLAHAHQSDGVFRLRLAFDRRWTDDPVSDDANGRAIFGLGVAVAEGPEHLRQTAHDLFRSAAAFRSGFPRATAHAVIGAAEVLSAIPDDQSAIALMRDAATTLPRIGEDVGWRWPESRLAYANALLPEALIAIGAALNDQATLNDGLRLLEWLVAEELHDGRFSFAPTGGRGPQDARKGFDQQPIEAASFVEASARAFAVTDDSGWLGHLERAVAWFLGENDAGVPLIDPLTGGCYDGLERSGVNGNEGGESTLMLVTALQHAERLLRPEMTDPAEAWRQRTAASAARSRRSEITAAPTLRSAAP